MDPNKTATPDKSLSDTFTTDRGYRNMDTLSDKVNITNVYPLIFSFRQAHRLIIPLKLKLADFLRN